MTAIWVANFIRMKEEGFVPDRDLILALTADEEGGDHNGVQWLIANQRELIDAALGEDTLVMERTIDVHIRALRRKMDGHAGLIETVRGVGYRFRDPASSEIMTAEAAM